MHTGARARKQKYISIYISLSMKTFLKTGVYIYIYIYIYIYLSLNILFIGRLGIRACVVLIPLLGVTWLFGAFSSTYKAFAYIFVIFNSTQVRCEPPSLRMHYSQIGKLTVGAAVFAIRHLHNSHKASGKVHMRICQKSFLQPKKS